MAKPSKDAMILALRTEHEKTLAALATAEAERDEARAAKDEFVERLTRTTNALTETVARAEAAEARLEAVREYSKDHRIGFGDIAVIPLSLLSADGGGEAE